MEGTNIVIKYSEKYMPRLNDKGKNPAKNWEIRYYLYNPTTGKYEKQRKSISPTAHNKGNYNKRLREANNIKANIRRKMNEGWLAESKAPKNAPSALPPAKTFEEAINEYIASKAQQPKMTKAIKAVVNSMQKNCKEILQKPLLLVDKQDCLLFKSIIQTKVSAISCNYYMRVLSCFFNYEVENQRIPQNPSKGIKPLRTKDSNANFPFTKEQRQSILETILAKGDHQLFLLCQFVYYTLARPYEEVQKLKVGNIREHDIFYPAETSKNGKSCAIPIAPSLEAIIQEYKLREYPAEYYIFGSKGVPSPKVQSKIFYARHRKILKELDLIGFDDKRYTLYGHKHTGAIALAERAKTYQDLRKIQMMCRHQNLEETEGYLRRMGVNLSLDDTSFLV